MKKIIAVLLLMSMLFSLVACAPPEVKNAEPAATTEAAVTPEAPAKVYKVGAVFTGPALDGGWNEGCFKGLKIMQDELGYETHYTDNIKQSDDESIIRQYAEQGYDLIIGHGWEYGPALEKVAKEYPDLHFLQTGGDAGGKAPNLASGVFTTGELGFLLSEVAAKLTKTNSTGFIAGFELPTIVGEYDMMRYTVPFLNPKAKAEAIYTGSWTDVAKTKETAKVMIDKGVDVIFGINNACDAGTIQALQESGKDVFFLGWSGDWHDAGPDVVATSGVQSFGVILKLVGESVQKGTFEGKMKSYGIKEGASSLGTWSSKVPENVKNEVMADFEKFKTGEYTMETVNKMIGFTK
ncbi:MAG: BMP family protein [Clostridia bacterium]